MGDTRKNSRINNNNLNFSNDPSLQEAIDFSRRINSEFSRINNNNIDSNDKEKSEIKNNDENTEQKKEQFVNNILQSMNANNKLEDERFGTATQVDNNSQNFQDTTNSFGRRRRQSNTKRSSFDARRNSQLTDTNENYFKDSSSFRDDRRPSKQQQRSYRIDDSTLLRNRMNAPFIESNGAQQLSSPQKVLTRQQQKKIGMK